MSKYLGIRIPDDLESLLVDLVKTTNKPKSFHVKKAIEGYLEEFTDYMDAVTILKQNKKAYSLEEVKERLGLTENE